MRFRGGEFSTGTMRNFQPELTGVCKRHDSMRLSRTCVQGMEGQGASG